MGRVQPGHCSDAPNARKGARSPTPPPLSPSCSSLLSPLELVDRAGPPRPDPIHEGPQTAHLASPPDAAPRHHPHTSPPHHVTSPRPDPREKLRVLRLERLHRLVPKPLPTLPAHLTRIPRAQVLEHLRAPLAGAAARPLAWSDRRCAGLQSPPSARDIRRSRARAAGRTRATPPSSHTRRGPDGRPPPAATGEELTVNYIWRSGTVRREGL